MLIAIENTGNACIHWSWQYLPDVCYSWLLTSVHKADAVSVSHPKDSSHKIIHIGIQRAIYVIKNRFTIFNSTVY